MSVAETAGPQATAYVARLCACLALGAGLWFSPCPEGLTPTGWRVLAVFAATIASFVLRPLPMAPMVLLALAILAATGTLPFETVLSGYGAGVIWLVVAAFLLAGAVKRTGLGQRIALLLVARLGRSTLGLGYALCGSELILAPFVPSNTARGGGILAPIVSSLARSLGSRPDVSPQRAGAYLVLVGAHANLVTAAMFLTAMAANVLVVEAARDVYGIEYDWGRWALAGAVPGLASLLLLPLLLLWLAPPTLTDARAAQQAARDELARLGPWTRGEKVMATVLVLLLVLWSTKGYVHDMGAGVVAWIGVCLLLFSRRERWQEVCRSAEAWDALIWLGGLVAMATALRDQGVVAWFSEGMQGQVAGLSGHAVALVLAAAYFYSMYGFSMLTGHVTALVAAFLGVAHAAGAPALLVVPLLAVFSNVCGCLTNYSTGPVVIYFGLGYVGVARWFRVGFVISLFHLTMWLGLGLSWWKFLGWW